MCPALKSWADRRSNNGIFLFFMIRLSNAAPSISTKGPVVSIAVAAVVSVATVVGVAALDLGSFLHAATKAMRAIKVKMRIILGCILGQR